MIQREPEDQSKRRIPILKLFGDSPMNRKYNRKFDDCYSEFRVSMKEFANSLKESLKEMTDDLKDDLSDFREEIQDLVESNFESVRGRDSYDHN